MAAGGSAERTELNAGDRAICERIGPALKKEGLAFVGIDVIGDFLIEVNVTSPTGLVEINRLNGVRLERDVIDYILRRLS
jgi:glutathione synthase